MKAMVLTANQKLEYQDLNLPELAADECKIQVKAVGVCSSDIHRGFGGGAYFYPLVMGHEFAGEVVETGQAVKDYKVGDRVAVFPLLPCRKCKPCEMGRYAQCTDYDYFGSRRHGGYAEYANIPTWNLLKIYDQVSFTNAAAMEPISVVLHALSKINFKDEGQEILILGAGFLGLIALHMIKFKHPHVKVTVIDRNAFKLERAASLGAQTQLIKTESDWAAYLKNQEASFPLVLEACGAPHTFRYSLSLAARFAKVVWMGNISADLTIPQNEISQVLRKEIKIFGVWNSDYQGAQPSDWTEALQYLKEGYSIENLITNQISITDLPQTLAKMYAHKMDEERFEAIKAMVQF